MRRLLIDAHQDLAYNMRTFQRDYRRSVAETRRLEVGGLAPEVNNDSLLGWPEYQQGRVALVFATLFAAPARRKLGDWDTQSYEDEEQAHLIYKGQLYMYQKLAEQQTEYFRLIQNRSDLDSHLAEWNDQTDEPHPVGFVILMENAEGVRSPDELEEWWQGGVRIIGPAWAGTRFCGGTREPGPLTRAGYDLLEGMQANGFILDLSHMDEQAYMQSLDAYEGTIIATHSSAKVLLKDVEVNRFLTDRMIDGLLEREGVIGIVPANGFLMTDWKSRGGKNAVSLQSVIDQIDYICQMAGDALHVGIGSDFDGGFGLQSVPAEINTIADLQKLAPLLAERGYTDADIDAIFHNNWQRVLRSSLP